MALLFAEHGLSVSLNDPSKEAMQRVADAAKKEGYGERIRMCDDYKELAQGFGMRDEGEGKDGTGAVAPRVTFFSLPHGHTGDKVLKGLLPCLDTGDVVVDAGNEYFGNTERRQDLAKEHGVRYVGCGVSGGYQAARRGPSMCPGGDDETLEMVMPLLRMVAAKDGTRGGEPCVAKAGRGGSGHYVKMLHNGIEHGMMSAIAEAFVFMQVGLGMELDEIADMFERWDGDGELRGTFLIKISADICRTHDPETHKPVLNSILDKVVQDMTGEEGTGVWSSLEAVAQHIPAPTLTSAHYLRLASAYRGHREHVHRAFEGGFPAQRVELAGKVKEDAIWCLKLAVYAACLASYAQGMNVIRAADRKHDWQIDYAAVWRIWRAGCIIQAHHISDMTKPLFYGEAGAERKDDMNMMLMPSVASELKRCYPALKKVVQEGVDADLVIPALSATLEYLKYESSVDLPTSFYEAQLDYFGAHMFDKKGEHAPDPTTGKHHFEWKLA